MIASASEFAEACNLTKVGSFHAWGMRPNANHQLPGLAPISPHYSRLDWRQGRRFPEQVDAGCIEVTVEGNGHDLRQLIAKRRDIFAAYLQMKPEERKDH